MLSLHDFLKDQSFLYQIHSILISIFTFYFIVFATNDNATPENTDTNPPTYL
jgi:hypothetical protein